MKKLVKFFTISNLMRKIYYFCAALVKYDTIY